MFDGVDGGEGRIVYVVKNAGELVSRQFGVGLPDAVDNVSEEVGG